MIVGRAIPIARCPARTPQAGRGRERDPRARPRESDSLHNVQVAKGGVGHLTYPYFKIVVMLPVPLCGITPNKTLIPEIPGGDHSAAHIGPFAFSYELAR